MTDDDDPHYRMGWPTRVILIGLVVAFAGAFILFGH